MSAPARVANKHRKIVDQSIAATANYPTYPTTGIDPMVFAGDFHGAEVIGMEWVAASVTGTNPTLDGKLQHSRDGVTWYDVDATNAKFTQLLAAGSQFVQIPANLELMPNLRIAFTVGGTNTPTFGSVKVYIHYNQIGPKGRLAPPGYNAKTT